MNPARDPVLRSGRTVAVRTDTDVFGESWPHHATLHLPPKLAYLRYVDFLMGRDLYCTVGEREEP